MLYSSSRHPSCIPRSESLGEGIGTRSKGVCLGLGPQRSLRVCPGPFSLGRRRDAYNVRLQRKAAADNGQDEAPRPGHSRPRQRLCAFLARPQLAPDATARESGSGGLVEQGQRADVPPRLVFARVGRHRSERSQMVRSLACSSIAPPRPPCAGVARSNPGIPSCARARSSRSRSGRRG